MSMFDQVFAAATEEAAVTVLRSQVLLGHVKKTAPRTFLMSGAELAKLHSEIARYMFYYAPDWRGTKLVQGPFTDTVVAVTANNYLPYQMTKGDVKQYAITFRGYGEGGEDVLNLFAFVPTNPVDIRSMFGYMHPSALAEHFLDEIIDDWRRENHEWTVTDAKFDSLLVLNEKTVQIMAENGWNIREDAIGTTVVATRDGTFCVGKGGLYYSDKYNATLRLTLETSGDEDGWVYNPKYPRNSHDLRVLVEVLRHAETDSWFDRTTFNFIPIELNEWFEVQSQAAFAAYQQNNLEAVTSPSHDSTAPYEDTDFSPPVPRPNFFFRFIHALSKAWAESK